MIDSTTGKQIVRDAYESAAKKVREINSTSPYLTATAIAAGIMHTILAMAAYTNEGEWSPIFEECKKCQAELLGAFR